VRITGTNDEIEARLTHLKDMALIGRGCFETPDNLLIAMGAVVKVTEEPPAAPAAAPKKTTAATKT
jgi:hypothetical protein